MQAESSSASAASFNAEDAGKSGFVHMRSTPQQQADPLGDLLVSKSDIKQAAEVVMGRLDITELVGGPQVQETAAQVSISTSHCNVSALGTEPESRFFRATCMCMHLVAVGHGCGHGCGHTCTFTAFDGVARCTSLDHDKVHFADVHGTKRSFYVLEALG